LLTRDESLRLKMATRGKLHAAGFRWEDAVRKTTDVYKELI